MCYKCIFSVYFDLYIVIEDLSIKREDTKTTVVLKKIFGEDAVVKIYEDTRKKFALNAQFYTTEMRQISAKILVKVQVQENKVWEEVRKIENESINDVCSLEILPNNTHYNELKKQLTLLKRVKQQF